MLICIFLYNISVPALITLSRCNRSSRQILVIAWMQLPTYHWVV